MISSTNNKKTISLVLGSGGARGLAHIGVIHWLEENGFEIKSIAGCSMGALIGGVYAAGKLDEYEQWVKVITKLDILSLLDISWDISGLVKGDKIIGALTELVGDKQIEELPISYTAVASDINAQKEVWINSGKLFDAIRASISLPLFFTPFDYHGTKLIDGGVLNPVPIAPTFVDKTDFTIAVNLGGKVEERAATNMVDNLSKKSDSGIIDKVQEFIQQFGTPLQKRTEIDLGVYDIANKAFDAMQATIARQKLASYPPDFTVEIATNACGTLEFYRASEMIALGYQKAQKGLKNALKLN